MSRILSIDYGLKRCGLAITDELQISINPLPSCHTSDLLDRIKLLVENNKIGDIVIGYPTHVDGTPTYLATQIQKLKTKILGLNDGLNVKFVDESFTSVEALDLMIQMGVKKKNRRKKSKIDQMSAVLILKSYINKKDWL